MDQFLSKYDSIFASGNPVIAARAPARLDVMGGIADYSGSLVLEGTLDRETLVAVQLRPDRDIVMHSVGLDPSQGNPCASIPINVLFESGNPITPTTLRDYFSGRQDITWSAYVIGVRVRCNGYIDDFYLVCANQFDHSSIWSRVHERDCSLRRPYNGCVALADVQED